MTDSDQAGNAATNHTGTRQPGTRQPGTKQFGTTQFGPDVARHNGRGRARRIARNADGRPGRWRRLPRWAKISTISLVAALVLAAAPVGWTRISAAGHLYDEADAPIADVVLVLGAQVAPDGVHPMPFLRGRLTTAAHLINTGRAKVALVSGDAHGGSGNETAVMTTYLRDEMGIPATRIFADPDGLDTYDSCVRAKQVYGVSSVLVVTQAYHAARAVALCRHAGLDADGVRAGCAGCSPVTLTKNALRDGLACGKAAWDVLSDRPPAVVTPASREITEALSRLKR